MALSPAQHAARAGKIGASFVPSLMAADPARMLEEWMRLTEHPSYRPADLSEIWAVQFGSWVEPFALDWHQARTGQPLTRRGEWVPHPELPYLGCTLDAYRDADASVIDCKAPGAHRRLDEVIAHYTGQLIVQRACTRAQRAALLVVHGGAEPREYAVSWSQEYEAEMWARIAWFWQRVETLQPPVAIEPNRVPVEAVRVVDMTGQNAWAYHAETWLGCREPARAFEQAAKSIKQLVEEDVATAHGHGITVARNRAGHMSIKESPP
jgi:predicted phage-related endonuclease